MKAKIVTTFVIAVILAVTLSGVKHIDNLNDSIKFKHIELKDNSVQLELLDQKYIDLNKQLEQKDSDKVKIEEDLKKLQEERDELSEQLQAKLEQKQKDIAVKAQNAVIQPQVASAATFSSGSGDCTSEISKYNWDHGTAVAVARAESGLNPGALNDNPATGDYSVGCFQINLYGSNRLYRPSEDTLKIASENVAYAHKIYTSNGNSFLGQWSVCNSMVNCY